MFEYLEFNWLKRLEYMSCILYIKYKMNNKLFLQKYFKLNTIILLLYTRDEILTIFLATLKDL